MKQHDISKYQLRKVISPSIVDKLLKNGHVDTRTINKICDTLHCQPGDIMEYVPDKSSENPKNIKLESTESNTSNTGDASSNSDFGCVKRSSQFRGSMK